MNSPQIQWCLAFVLLFWCRFATCAPPAVVDCGQFSPNPQAPLPGYSFPCVAVTSSYLSWDVFEGGALDSWKSSEIQYLRHWFMSRFSEKEAVFASLTSANYDSVPYQTQYPGADLTIYRYQNGWTANQRDLNTIKTFPVVLNVIMPVYKPFSQPLNIVLILEPSFIAVNLGVTTSSPDGSQCYVRIYRRKTNSNDILTLEQTIAHEVYHCVEKRNAPAIQDTGPEKWWLEGSAEYFSEYFYPSIDPDAFIKSYIPEMPLWDQSYSGSTFFAYMDQAIWSQLEINNFVQQHPQILDPAGELKYLATIEPIKNTFPGFAAAFKDGKIQTPNTKDGSMIKSNHHILNKILAPKISAVGAVDNSATFSVQPYTIHSYSAALDAGQTVGITFTSDDDTSILQYRLRGTKAWTAIHANDADQFDIACGSTARFDFLLTSTGNTDVVTGVISFTKSAKKKCKNSCKRGGRTSCPIDTLDPCLVGSWNLDTAALRALFLAELKAANEVVDDITITGTSTLKITTPNDAYLTFTDLNIHADLEAAGMKEFANTKTTGTAQCQIVKQNADSFAWAPQDVTGQTVITSTVTTLDETEDLKDALFLKGILMKYTCSSNALSLHWTYFGHQTYVLSYKKA